MGDKSPKSKQKNKDQRANVKAQQKVKHDKRQESFDSTATQRVKK